MSYLKRHFGFYYNYIKYSPSCFLYSVPWVMHNWQSSFDLDNWVCISWNSWLVEGAISAFQNYLIVLDVYLCGCPWDLWLNLLIFLQMLSFNCQYLFRVQIQILLVSTSLNTGHLHYLFIMLYLVFSVFSIGVLLCYHFLPFLWVYMVHIMVKI